MLKSIRNSLIFTSLLYIVLGLVLVVQPGLSLGVARLFIGGVTLIYGVVRIVSYKRSGQQDRFELFVGILLALLGLFMLVWLQFLMALVPLFLGVYILVDSVGAVKRSLDMKSLGFDRWWISCLVAALLGVCGLVMIFDPFGTLEGLVMFIGFGFLFDGVYTLVNTILLERLR